MSLFDYRSDADTQYTFVIGNGINLLENDKTSWLGILNSLNKNDEIAYVSGFPLTEYFDLIALNSKQDYQEYKNSFINNLSKLNGSDKHKLVFEHCELHGIALLTTNFDHGFQKSNHLKQDQLRSFKKGFTHVYPWQRFYSRKNPNTNAQSIPLYHINGDMKYKKSIKLSILDYANNISYFNRNFNPNKKNGKKKFTEAKEKTWINYFFDNSLVFAGLDLGESEIFLRFLLMERYRYRQKYKKYQKQPSGFYLYCVKDFAGDDNEEKLKRYQLFFKSVNIQMVPYNDYELIFKKKGAVTIKLLQ